MKLSKIIGNLDYLSIHNEEDFNIDNIAYDSRKVKENSIFVCIEGYKTDGHNYAEDAVKKGAKVLVVSKDVGNVGDTCVIRVEDTRLALAHLASEFFGNPSEELNLVGVTGTKGKTTITYMIKMILGEVGEKVGVIGTIQNSIGDDVLKAERTTPESLELQELFREMLNRKASSCVMEVSSHALELKRVANSKFNIGIFTNITRDHLDFHETFENYYNAKKKLFSLCDNGVINVDCQYGNRLTGETDIKFLTFGIDKDADIKASDIVLNSDSVEFKVHTPKWEDTIKVNIPGKFTVYNALAAIAASVWLQIPCDDVKNALKKVKVPGRAELVEVGKDYTIIIDYAHSPDSLENILTTVKNYASGRTVSVFGCGGDRDRTKRPIMGEVSGKIADYSIITSDNPRTEDPAFIISEIEEGMKKTNSKYTTIVDRRSAIKYAMENAQKDDVIVLSGKGHETYQIFKDKTIDFDERKVIFEIVEELKKEGKWD